LEPVQYYNSIEAYWERWLNMPKTQEQMVQTIYEKVVGLSNNPQDNGLIGKVDNIEKLLVSQNGAIRLNAQNIAVHANRIRNIEKTLEEGIQPRFTKKQYVAGGFGGVSLVTTLIISLGKVLGWF